MTGSEFNQALQGYENTALARHSREIEEAEDEDARVCASCRLYETPRCWERKQSGRNPGALDWCAGFRGKP